MVVVTQRERQCMKKKDKWNFPFLKLLTHLRYQWISHELNSTCLNWLKCVGKCCWFFELRSTFWFLSLSRTIKKDTYRWAQCSIICGVKSPSSSTTAKTLSVQIFPVSDVNLIEVVAIVNIKLSLWRFFFITVRVCESATLLFFLPVLQSDTQLGHLTWCAATDCGRDSQRSAWVTHGGSWWSHLVRGASINIWFENDREVVSNSKYLHSLLK